MLKVKGLTTAKVCRANNPVKARKHPPILMVPVTLWAQLQFPHSLKRTDWWLTSLNVIQSLAIICRFYIALIRAFTLAAVVSGWFILGEPPRVSDLSAQHKDLNQHKDQEVKPQHWEHWHRHVNNALTVNLFESPFTLFCFHMVTQQLKNIHIASLELWSDICQSARVISDASLTTRDC